MPLQRGHRDLLRRIECLAAERRTAREALAAADEMAAAIEHWLGCQECGEGTDTGDAPLACECRLENAMDAYNAVRPGTRSQEPGARSQEGTATARTRLLRQLLAPPSGAS
jgi:hypothetical protein